MSKRTTNTIAILALIAVAALLVWLVAFLWTGV